MIRKPLFYFLLLVLISSCSCREIIANKTELLGRDYRLFQNTIAWELAKSVEDQDTNRIIEAVKKSPEALNFQEERFGQTLLMLSVENQHFISFQTLLKLGADVNICNSNEGASAIIYSAGVYSSNSDDLKYLRLLLQYGANPNDIEKGKRQEGNTTRNTPLLIAVGRNMIAENSLDFIKCLIDAGADINLGNEFGGTPFSHSVTYRNYDATLFLLEKNVNHRVPIVVRNGDTLFVEDLLHEIEFPVGSEEEKGKIKVLRALKEKGIEYPSR